MRRADEDQWDALIAEYVRVVRDTTGAPEAVALKAASTMVRAFRLRFAGVELYISHPPRYDEAAVLRDIRPDNVEEVCSRHHIHRSTLYRVVARAKARGESVPELPQPQSTAPAAAARRAGKDEFSW